MDCSSSRLLCPWGFSRQEYWIELPCPSPGALPDRGIKSTSLTSLVLTGGFFTLVPIGKLGSSNFRSSLVNSGLDDFLKLLLYYLSAPPFLFPLDNTWSIFYTQFTVVEILSKSQSASSKAVVPNLFGIRDQFCGRGFFHRPEVRGGLGMIQAHYIYCVLYFYYYYINSTSGIRSQRLGTPALKHIWSPSPCHRTEFSLRPPAPFVTWPFWFSDLISHQFLISHLALIILSWTHYVSTMGPLHLLVSASALPRSLPSSLPGFSSVISERPALTALSKMHDSCPQLSFSLPGFLIMIITWLCYIYFSLPYFQVKASLLHTKEGMWSHLPLMLALNTFQAANEFNSELQWRCRRKVDQSNCKEDRMQLRQRQHKIAGFHSLST